MTELEQVAADLEHLNDWIKKGKTELNRLADVVSALEKKEKPWEWWLPEINVEFFYIDTDGEIMHDVWSGTNLDNAIRANHNIFRTKQDAELFAPLNKWQRAVAWVLRELNGGWLPDWEKSIEDRWCFTYDHTTGQIRVVDADMIQNQNSLSHGKSAEVLRKCREILGDEIIEKSCGYFRK